MLNISLNTFNIDSINRSILPGLRNCINQASFKFTGHKNERIVTEIKHN